MTSSEPATGGESLRWLEIAADHRCNQRCLGCPVEEAGPSLRGAALVRALENGRRRGIEQLWIGGGEPTLRRDLLPFVREARARGYRRIKLQTNVAMLANPDVAARLAQAGVDEIAASLKGADAATHDRLARTPGAFDLLLRGLARARDAGLALEGDVLLYRTTTATLPDIVRRFVTERLARFRVWMMAPDVADPDALAEEPRLGEVAAAVAAACALEPAVPIESLHTPPCLLPGTAARARFFAPELGLWVEDAGGSSFRLEDSPIEGGHYPARCAGCSLRPRCGGVRAAYVARHGDAELRPARGGEG